jgi:hypothetical protein
MPKRGDVRTEQVSFRADKAFVERIDGLRAAMKKGLRGVEVTRSDLLKALIEMSLPIFELQHTARVHGMTEDETVEWFGELFSHLHWLVDAYNLTDENRALDDVELVVRKKRADK